MTLCPDEPGLGNTAAAEKALIPTFIIVTFRPEN